MWKSGPHTYLEAGSWRDQLIGDVDSGGDRGALWEAERNCGRIRGIVEVEGSQGGLGALWEVGSHYGRCKALWKFKGSASCLKPWRGGHAQTAIENRCLGYTPTLHPFQHSWRLGALWGTGGYAAG